MIIDRRSILVGLAVVAVVFSQCDGRENAKPLGASAPMAQETQGDASLCPGLSNESPLGSDDSN